MLKKFFVLVAFAIISSSAFADYKGDLQLRGLGFGNATLKVETFPIHSELENDSGLYYDFGLYNYNTWTIASSPIGVGFATGFDLGIGDAILADFYMGPAFTAIIGNVVKFDFSLGFLWMAASVSSCPMVDKVSISGIDFAMDFVAVFLPNAVFSPTLGINYNVLSNGVEFSPSSSLYSDGNGDLSNIRFFIGGTFNFGRK